jgi:hypothetical protein
MIDDELQQKKDIFLNRYNAERSLGKANSDAIMSAVQHNSLYDVPEKERNLIRADWADLLKAISLKYAAPVTASQYELDIESLKQIMNERFSGQFRRDRHPKYDYDPGFRISHAQKSIAVFLKHKWCMGAIDVPPQCPVDNIVLEAAGLRYPETKWAYVNTIEEHRVKIAPLAARAQASGLELAEWELVAFQA